MKRMKRPDTHAVASPGACITGSTMIRVSPRGRPNEPSAPLTLQFHSICGMRRFRTLGLDQSKEGLTPAVVAWVFRERFEMADRLRTEQKVDPASGRPATVADQSTGNPHRDWRAARSTGPRGGPARLSWVPKLGGSS